MHPDPAASLSDPLLMAQLGPGGNLGNLLGSLSVPGSAMVRRLHRVHAVSLPCFRSALLGPSCRAALFVAFVCAATGLQSFPRPPPTERPPNAPLPHGQQQADPAALRAAQLALQTGGQQSGMIGLNLQQQLLMLQNQQLSQQQQQQHLMPGGLLSSAARTTTPPRRRGGGGAAAGGGGGGQLPGLLGPVHGGAGADAAALGAVVAGWGGGGAIGGGGPGAGVQHHLQQQRQQQPLAGTARPATMRGGAAAAAAGGLGLGPRMGGPESSAGIPTGATWGSADFPLMAAGGRLGGMPAGTSSGGLGSRPAAAMMGGAAASDGTAEGGGPAPGLLQGLTASAMSSARRRADGGGGPASGHEAGPSSIGEWGAGGPSLSSSIDFLLRGGAGAGGGGAGGGGNAHGMAAQHHGGAVAAPGTNAPLPGAFPAHANLLGQQPSWPDNSTTAADGRAPAAQHMANLTSLLSWAGQQQPSSDAAHAADYPGQQQQQQ